MLMREASGLSYHVSRLFPTFLSFFLSLYLVTTCPITCVVVVGGWCQDSWTYPEQRELVFPFVFLFFYEFVYKLDDVVSSVFSQEGF